LQAWNVPDSVDSLPMKSLSLLVLLVFFACSSCIELGVQNDASSSSSTSSNGSNSSSGGQGGQGGGVGGNDVTSGSGGSVAAFCDPNDETLIACYQFEGNSDDGSKYNNSTTAINVKYETGVDGQAASFDLSGQVAIANTANWNVTQYTAEAWYYQRSYSATRMGVFDSHNRLGMFVYGQGNLRCSRTPDIFITRPSMPLNQWNHVSCVFDGMVLSMYVNGKLESSIAAPPIVDGATSAIGSNAPSGEGFDGLIDNVRVWSVAHSAKEVCISAGLQGC